ncbi:MAG: hypothetical protein ACOYJG_11885 [Prevotella sp.]|jgi:hypothetical protein
MNKKRYIKPNSTLVKMALESVLTTISGTDLPSTGMGGDTSDSSITPEAKENTLWDDYTEEPWQ